MTDIAVEFGAYTTPTPISFALITAHGCADRYGAPEYFVESLLVWSPVYGKLRFQVA